MSDTKTQSEILELVQELRERVDAMNEGIRAILGGSSSEQSDPWKPLTDEERAELDYWDNLIARDFTDAENVIDEPDSWPDGPQPVSDADLAAAEIYLLDELTDGSL